MAAPDREKQPEKDDHSSSSEEDQNALEVGNQCITVPASVHAEHDREAQPCAPSVPSVPSCPLAYYVHQLNHGQFALHRSRSINLVRIGARAL